ncbi:MULTISPECIES: hypothetical protein [unclassified Leeuwenhoekiella]|uniref:hypothetical protein n=1 Tax=unclassified Leeuwenhoekiella TaxID=2615029 RepID=UPI000C5DC903|nr:MULTISPECIES: hypothetical protein [unclassified Leeuwenhoekiella]MAW97057.1 hypothetical protein [Leeuwenhoekiella sp.]MBA80662.1 hypothetical protein [Leeuwenhoekiella sp.]|tara:strand:- start:7894 stop:8499 length:606 start_codon:yes stop_codon:yes gene_type:complete
MNFIKKLFGKQKNNDVGNFIVATLNDKIMPLDRGEIYEDPLDELLKAKGIGEVSGGGTMQLKSGELEYCDLEIKLNSNEINQNDIQLIINKLEELGAPKGSKLTIEKTDQKIEFGQKEGLGIYIDGVNLDPEVYKNSDINFVISELKKMTNDKSEITRYWEGTNETALYYYSDSFAEMNESIQEFVKSYPLCKGARIEQLA